DRNRSHWSTSKTPSYTKSVSWQHHRVDVVSKAVINYDIEKIYNRNNTLLLTQIIRLKIK
ncbi:hypothetical protein OSK11_17120, partial [Escherichia coli]